MLFVASHSLRSHLRLFAGTIITVAAAVAIATACALLLDSGLHGGAHPERLAGVPIVVQHRQTISVHHGRGDDAETETVTAEERARLDLREADRLVQLPGVAAVVPDRSFRAVLLDRSGRPVTDDRPSWGHPWASAPLTPFTLASGRPPGASGQVVIDAGLARRAGVQVGDRTTAVVAGEPSGVTVVGIARPPAGDELTTQAALFLDDASASRAYGHDGQVDELGLLLRPGADRDATANAARGPHLVVRTGDERGRAEFLSGANANVTLIAISGAVGGIGLVVAVFVIAGMIGLVVQQRRRDLALLRATGATPRQLRRMIALETFVVSLVGVAIGVYPGTLLAHGLAGGMRDHGVLPPTFHEQVSPLPVLIAAVAAMAVAQVAARLAARRATRLSPTEALSPLVAEQPRVGVVRIAIGSLAAAGTIALFLVAGSSNAGVAAAMAPALITCGLLAVGLLAPLLVVAGVAVLGVVTRATGASGFLAAANTRTSARRLAAAVTPVVLLVAVSGLTLFQQSTLDRETSRQGDARLVADRVVDAGPAGIPADDVATLTRAPSVSTAIGLVPTTVYGGSDLDALVAKVPTPGPLDAVLDLQVESGSLDGLGAGDVALSDTAADRLGAHARGTVQLWLGDGTKVHRRVAAVYRRPLGFGDVVLPWQDVIDGHVTDPSVTTVLVANREVATGDSTIARFAAAHPGSRAGGRQLEHDVEDANAATQAWVSQALLGVIIVFVALALVNTLVMLTAARRDELGLLQLVGATPRQVRGMMRRESVIVIVLGIAFGAAIAAATVLPYGKALTGSYTVSSPAREVLALVGAAFALGVAATLVTTRFVLRQPPIDAVSHVA